MSKIRRFMDMARNASAHPGRLATNTCGVTAEPRYHELLSGEPALQAIEARIGEPLSEEAKRICRWPFGIVDDGKLRDE